MIGLIIAAVLAAEILLIIFLPVIGWSILGFLGLFTLLILLVPIGAELGYVGAELSLSAKVSAFSIRLLPKKPKDESKPKKPKEKKPKKEKKEKPSETEEAKESILKKLNLSVDEILEILKKVFRGLGKFGKLTVHKFMLHYVAAGKDPYSTAMTYNYVNAALSSLAPLCDKGFKVKGDVDVWTNVDFTRDKMQLDVELSITLRLIQLLHVALAIAFGVLSVLIKNMIRVSKEKRAAKKENKNAAPDNNTEDTTQTNIKTEERTDYNG